MENIDFAPLPEIAPIPEATQPYEPLIPPVPETEPYADDSSLEEVLDQPIDDVVTEAGESISLRSRVWQRAKSVFKAEAAGNIAEAAGIAVGLPVPARVGIDAVIDNWAYGPSAEEGEKPGRRAQLGTAAGMLAVNLASSYALQKGVPVALEAIDENFNTAIAQTATMLAGKVGVMSTAAPIIGRRFSR